MLLQTLHATHTECVPARAPRICESQILLSANKQLADSIKPTANSAVAECCNSLSPSLSSTLFFSPYLSFATFAYWLLVSTFDNATMQFVTGNGSCCCDCDCDIGHVQTACDIKKRPSLEWQATSINCESVNKIQQQKSERNHNAELCQQQLPQP